MTFFKFRTEKSLIIDSIVAGIRTVLIPSSRIFSALYLFGIVLEDIGYMSRIALLWTVFSDVLDFLENPLFLC